MPCEPLRIALVAEGPTDLVILQAILQHLVAPRPVIFRILQPETDATFHLLPGSGGGWGGVYRWCRQTAEMSGGQEQFSSNPLLFHNDLFMLQLDGDVAGFTYSSCHIHDPPRQDLPLPPSACPPVTQRMMALHQVIMGWLEISTLPDNALFCTPAMNLENWILVALWPENRLAASVDVECKPADGYLQQQPASSRLISGNKKILERYQAVAPAVVQAWPVICQRCSQAARFEREFLNKLKSCHHSIQSI